MRKNTAVFGLYADRQSVEGAIEELLKGGFRSADISVLFARNKGSKDFAHEKHTKAPEGALSGAILGGLAGTALGWLAGLGAVVVPELGSVTAAGPIVVALAGLGVGGSLGGFSGALIGAGLPEYEARRYVGRLKKGHILLSVHCDSREWIRHARKILRRTGGEDVAAEREIRADYAASEKPVERGREGLRW